MTLVDPTPRMLGSLGEVGAIAFGMWRFTDADLERRRALVESALDNGLNLIDTADVYGLDWNGTGFGSVEEALGEVLRTTPGLRDRMVLATKGGIKPPVPYDSSPEGLRTACEDSLRRLGVDTIDLYQIHRPDMFAHPAEVAATLAALRTEGKIREVGVSNHTVAQTEALAAHLPFPIVSTQPEFSAAELAPMRDGTMDMCMRSGVLPLAWSPLAGGRLATGSGVPAELVSVLDEIAARESTDRATVALAFVLAHPARPIAIIGTQRPERIAEATAAASVRLERSDVYAIVQASEGRPLP
ncbi:MAG: aldo/keto reductase [Ilumatobacteraceae bacterium]